MDLGDAKIGAGRNDPAADADADDDTDDAPANVKSGNGVTAPQMAPNMEPRMN